MNTILLTPSGLFLLIAACLIVGVTLGAVIAELCGAARRAVDETCVCRTTEPGKAPEIDVLACQVVPSLSGIHILAQFHTNRQWLLKFREHVAVQAAHDIISIAADRELQREEAERKTP